MQFLNKLSGNKICNLHIPTFPSTSPIVCFLVLLGCGFMDVILYSDAYIIICNSSLDRSSLADKISTNHENLHAGRIVENLLSPIYCLFFQERWEMTHFKHNILIFDLRKQCITWNCAHFRVRSRLSYLLDYVLIFHYVGRFAGLDYVHLAGHFCVWLYSAFSV